MINAGVTKATKNHEVHNAFLFVMRHPPSAAEASGGGTRYSFSARGRCATLVSVVILHFISQRLLQMYPDWKISRLENWKIEN